MCIFKMSVLQKSNKICDINIDSIIDLCHLLQIIKLK